MDSTRFHTKQLHRAVVLVLSSLGLCAEHVDAQSLGLELVIGGIDRPSHVVQAYGDPNSLYYIEQRAGRIMNLDLTSGTTSTVVSFTGFDTTIEGGVHTMAFHPQFEQNGLFYVSWLEDGGPGIGDYGNVDEYQLVSGQGQFTRRILRHQIRGDASTHSLDWVGFDPTATGAEQNYLYITTGDGGFDGASTGVDYAQDLSTLFGKVSRIDISSDDFPDEADRNYAIPASNPYASDGDPDTRGEILLSGLRNPWRMSFDTENGDIYIGDVGQGAFEEINFARAGESGYDFGWNAFEGTQNRNKASLNPDPLFPIHQYDHSEGNVSVTGGYVYHGPIESIQGDYFFADFNTANVWSATFDRETATEVFDGTNMAIASRTDELNASLLGGRLNHIVSFGEELDGNLLLVDYGEGDLFNPTPNTGAIYRFVETVPIIPGDLNQDTLVNLIDWGLMKSGFLADLTDLDAQSRFFMGDLNLSGVVDLFDFELFRTAYEQNNGAGSFSQLSQPVPEPVSLATSGIAFTTILIAFLMRRKSRVGNSNSRVPINRVDVQRHSRSR